jgi:hypothetical protein
MGVRDIFPLMKWVNIFDLVVDYFSRPMPSSILLVKSSFGYSIFPCSSTSMSIGNLLFGTLMCENKLCPLS